MVVGKILNISDGPTVVEVFLMAVLAGGVYQWRRWRHWAAAHHADGHERIRQGGPGPVEARSALPW